MFRVWRRISKATICVLIIMLISSSCKGEKDTGRSVDLNSPSPDKTRRIASPSPTMYVPTRTSQHTTTPTSSVTQLQRDRLPTTSVTLTPPASIVDNVIQPEIIREPHAPDQRIGSVSFVDMDHGWLSTGRKIFSTNNGSSWEWLIELEAEVLDLHFITPDTGWALTGDNLFRSEDSGRSWDDIPIPHLNITPRLGINIVLSKIHFIDMDHGWLGDGWSLWSTLDGGENWERLSLPCTELPGYWRSNIPFSSFFFSSRLRGYLLCGGNPLGAMKLARKWLFITQDGGLSWKFVTGANVGPEEPGNLPGMGYYPEFIFLDEMHVWMTTRSSGVYHSRDSGKNWDYVKLPYPEIPITSSPQFFNDSQGYVLIDSPGFSTLVKTTDGGESWIPVFTTASVDYLSFIDPTTGYAILRSSVPNRIIKTSDGGRSWMPVGDMGGFVADLIFSDELKGMAIVSNSDAGVSESKIIRSEDGGQTWKLLRVSGAGINGFRSILFFDGEYGIIREGIDRLIATQDGGESFYDVGYISAGDNDIQFVSMEYGWKILDERLWETQDSGRTWTSLPFDFLVKGFQVLTEGTAWVLVGNCGAESTIYCEPQLLSTADGGQTWTLINFEADQFRSYSPEDSFYFIDKDIGWIFLRDGLYQTRDGGASWYQVGSLYSD